MQVNNDTDEDLDIEIDGSRPGIDGNRFRCQVPKKGSVPIPPSVGAITRARIFSRGDVDCLWVQRFKPAVHELVFRDAIVAKES